MSKAYMNTPSIEDLLTTSLFSIQAEKEDIELVCKNDLFLYVYKDDWYYTSIKKEDRDFDLNTYKRRVDNIDNQPDLYLKKNPLSTAESLLLDVARSSDKNIYLDVGTNYGQWVIRAKKILKHHKLDIETIAFEPGHSARLAVINIAFHKHMDIKFILGAVSNVTDIIPFFSCKGHSEDNKCVNRPIGSIAFPSYSTTLSDVLSNYTTSKEFFIKIDTQGAELEVMEGLGSFSHDLTCIMEFSPKSISSRKKPIDFLNIISQDFHLIHLDAHQNYVSRIPPNNFSSFISEIWNKKFPFCDLALISKKHRRLEQLINIAVET